MKKKNHAKGFVDIVNDAKTRIQEIDINTLTQWMNEGKAHHVIDVRETSEWENSHIPNAIHLSKGVLEMSIEKTIPDRDACIVLHCGGGYRSALAAENLQRMGYTDVYSLDGGFRAWLMSQQV